ncbi:hypothetical protein M3212_19645, partial [Alkalihalobacillus oceani]|uniref:hypothetical protein n=1 Tax=Halalkalibacter oceani TaxID=1653776 RepID=UPI00203D29F1
PLAASSSAQKGHFTLLCAWKRAAAPSRAQPKGKKPAFLLAFTTLRGLHSLLRRQRKRDTSPFYVHGSGLRLRLALSQKERSPLSFWLLHPCAGSTRCFVVSAKGTLHPFMCMEAAAAPSRAQPDGT